MCQLIDLIFAGLDVKGVSAVVNYDLANNTEDYVHRWEIFCIFSSGVHLSLSQDWSNRKSWDEGGEFHVHHQVRGGYLEDDGDS